VGTTTAEADALNNQSQAALETQKLVEMRYQAGIDDQLRYLDAQRSAWAIQIGAIESNSAKEIAQTSLFKALGGQWISGNNSYAKN
jgi:multidrug efflux system outer membrane protein